MNIVLDQVSKAFTTQKVLVGVTFDVTFEHTLALVGPSGGGKSTLLRLLAGLERADSGEIRIDGEVLPTSEEGLRIYRKKIGIVFQAYNLFPHLTALENIVLPLVNVHKIPQREANERANELLKRLQLADHAHKQPALLSGGQCQRVAIARALAIDPHFLLLDEPTSALDPEMTAEVLDVIAELRESGKPIVLVTHEMGFAQRSAGVIAFVADGSIGECAPPAEFFDTPKSPNARRFLDKVLKY